MTDQALEGLALEFIKTWDSFEYARHGGYTPSFEKSEMGRKLIDMGFVANHINPRVGEYAIQHVYTGVAFFTGNGELVFTEEGLPFAKKICDFYRRRCSDMHVVKVEYDPAKN